MIYHISATISVDTKTNKIVVLVNEEQIPMSEVSYERRIAITPVTNKGPDVYVVENDRMAGQYKTATELCRWLAQNLLGRKQIKELAAKEKKNSEF